MDTPRPVYSYAAFIRAHVDTIDSGPPAEAAHLERLLGGMVRDLIPYLVSGEGRPLMDAAVKSDKLLCFDLKAYVKDRPSTEPTEE